MRQVDRWLLVSLSTALLLVVVGTRLSTTQPQAPTEPPPPACRDGHVRVAGISDDSKRSVYVCIPGYLP